MTVSLSALPISVLPSNEVLPVTVRFPPSVVAAVTSKLLETSALTKLPVVKLAVVPVTVVPVILVAVTLVNKALVPVTVVPVMLVAVALVNRAFVPVTVTPDIIPLPSIVPVTVASPPIVTLSATSKSSSTVKS